MLKISPKIIPKVPIAQYQIFTLSPPPLAVAVLSVVCDSYKPLHFMLLFPLWNFHFRLPSNLASGLRCVADLNNPLAPCCPAWTFWSQMGTCWGWLVIGDVLGDSYVCFLYSLIGVSVFACWMGRYIDLNNTWTLNFFGGVGGFFFIVLRW